MPAEAARDDDLEAREPEQKPHKIAIAGAGSKAIRIQKERSRGTTRRWATSAAGLPCTIELQDDGCWVVTIASASMSRRNGLTEAILEASGGLLSQTQAFELTAAIYAKRGLDRASS